jgi:Helix-turn-helix domain
MSRRLCSVPGCHGKHLCRGFCGTHYVRWYERGTTDPPTPGPRSHRRVTATEQAEIARLYASGLTMREVGDRLGRSQPTIHLTLHKLGVEVRRPGQPSGERHSLWKGQRLISHREFHKYLQRQRGAASNYTCACGAPAEQWSYHDAGADHEVIDTTAGPTRGLRFSTDVMQYRARCTICHQVYDGRVPLLLHEILELRECWATGEWPTIADLAHDFNVTTSYARRIINGDTWKTLTRQSLQVRYWLRHSQPTAL